MVNRGGEIIMRRILHVSVSREALINADRIISSAKKEGYELHDVYAADRLAPNCFVTLVFEFVGLSKESKGKKK